jgi:hypothetical protein
MPRQVLYSKNVVQIKLEDLLQSPLPCITYFTKFFTVNEVTHHEPDKYITQPHTMKVVVRSP